MHAMLVIVQSQDAEAVLEWLSALNLPCLERIASFGSFLQQSNTAFWLAVPPEQVEAVMNTLRHTCHRRVGYMPAFTTETAPFLIGTPLEVEVGGAIVFMCEVEHFEVF
jgi:uncharacterized protein YaaQ